MVDSSWAAGLSTAQLLMTLTHAARAPTTLTHAARAPITLNHVARGDQQATAAGSGFKFGVGAAAAKGKAAAKPASGFKFGVSKPKSLAGDDGVKAEG